MGNKRHLRPKYSKSRIRPMAWPKGMKDFPYMAVLKPDWWNQANPTHSDIIAMAREWGPCRVSRDHRPATQRTRIYFKNEVSLVILKTAVGNSVWKMYRSSEIAE